MSTAQKRIESWLKGPYSEEVKKEILRLQKEDPKGLEDAFFQDLSFGTGGMRALMGVGTNRLNVYTIRRATQGLVNAITRLKKGPYRVFIGYDVRHNSRRFAEEAAKVFAGNQIQALLSKEVCPTPLVSFACRHYRCQAAIVITASHNPPEYNGYKVYWEGGGQVVSPYDEEITQEILKIQSPNDVRLKDEFEEVGEELDVAYLKELKKLQLTPSLCSVPLKIIYTNLHGTGIRTLPKALKSWGYEDVVIVKEQSALDGDFPNAGSPNPEEAQALECGLKVLKKEKGDLLIATDPDADRIAVSLENERLTGNEMASICLEYLAQTLHSQNKFPKNGAVVKSIVTTELFKKIAERHGAHCIEVLTGFKYIAEKISQWEKSPGGYEYLFGAEESYGCLFGTFVRDKDASSAACLIAEIAAFLKKQNRTLLDMLYEIYETYGIHQSALKNLKFPDSKEGMEKMGSLMQTLRAHPLKYIGKKKILKVDDFLHGFEDFPPSDVLRFWIQDGARVIVRPSGTEPKIKIYSEVVKKRERDMEEEMKLLKQEATQLIDNLVNSSLDT